MLCYIDRQLTTDSSNDQCLYILGQLVQEVDSSSTSSLWRWQ